MHLDAKDRRILYELDYGARTPLSQIGKKLRLPKQVVSYRIRSLQQKGVIRGFSAVINLHRLGYFIYRVYIRFQNLPPEGENTIFEKLALFPNITWLAATSGSWDAEVQIAAKNNIHFGTIFRELKKELGGSLRDYAVSPAIGVFHFRRKYLVERGESEQVQYGFEPKEEKIDRTDFAILKFLSKNGAASLIDVGAAAGMSYNAAKARMLSLENKGIISSYRAWLDTEKLGRKFYKALISFSGLDEKAEKSLVSFCLSEPSVVYIVECTGSWDIELEAEAKDESEFRSLLLRFRSRFSGAVKQYETLHVHAERRMDYFPFEKYDELSQ